MFLNVLSIDEKGAFAELAERMVQADGIVIGRETAALAALKAEMGVSGAVGTDRSIGELATIFGSKRSKIAALLELIGLGYSDTNFHIGEESLVAGLARDMGIGADELNQLEGWVEDHVSLVRRALVLMRD
ncbi:MAG: hypothetical protein ACC742_12115 [Thermoanaerobaculales bacterium]